jgi:hypothetical protein
LLSCMANAFASCAVGRTAGCYCSDATCSAGANGPCAPLFEAVAHSNDPAEVLRQLAEPGTILHGVSAEIQAFASSSCGRSCAGF